MVVCGSCGKENQDLYKFCLACGADLGGMPSAPFRAPRATPGTAPPVFSDMGPTDGTDPQISYPSEPTQNKKWGGNGQPEEEVTPVPTAPAEPPMVAPAPPSSARMCPTCGATVEPAHAFCANCGGRVG